MNREKKNNKNWKGLWMCTFFILAAAITAYGQDVNFSKDNNNKPQGMGILPPAPNLEAVKTMGTENTAEMENAMETEEALNRFIPVLPGAEARVDPVTLEIRRTRPIPDQAEHDRVSRMLKAQSATTGESADGTILIPSTSMAAAGDPVQNPPGSSVDPNGLQKVVYSFGNDVHVRLTNAETQEWNQTMVSDSYGNLFVAWQDNLLFKDCIQFYRSTDDGDTWQPFGFVYNTSADLKEPSLTFGGGVEKWLLLAYIVDDGVNMPYPEVARISTSAWKVTFHSVPVWQWEGYAKPVIITTTSPLHDWWIGFLTCEGIFDSAKNNINICAWASHSWGVTWHDEQVVFGNTDAYTWVDPDIAFGTTLERAFIVCYNATDMKLYYCLSDDMGATYKDHFWAFEYSSSFMPLNDPDPEIEAALYDDNVLICTTGVNMQGYDAPVFMYNDNALQQWWFYAAVLLHNDMDHHLFSVALDTHRGGQDWHLTFTGDHHVYYARLAQDLSPMWYAPKTPVDDAGYASHVYPKKGITCDWDTNKPIIAWCDYRDLTPDYDTYVDRRKEHILTADTYGISETTGGAVNFELDAGKDHDSKLYLLLGSISGTSPGTNVPGAATLPINWDVFTSLNFKLLNTPLFKDFFGILNSSGEATAQLNTGGPLPPGFTGTIIHFAFFVPNWPWGFTSNPVNIEIIP